MNKPCSKCGEDKALSEFHKDRSNLDGLTSACKVCNNETNATSRLNNPHTASHSGRKARYGITDDQYVKMLVNQNYSCGICNNILGEKQSVAVDHCHTTGKVRGILCSSCNRALGAFGDNIAVLERAALYLEGKL